MSKKKIRKKAKKVYQYTWAFEPFEEEDDFFTKKMFGCLAAYCHGKMVMLLAENPGDREYRGNKFDFDIWNGVLFPTEYEYQDKITKKYKNLIQHPVLKKWLYLPHDSNHFENDVNRIGKEIQKNNKHFGIYPKVD